MSSTRFFGGSKTTGSKSGSASSMMREQLKKGGKIDAAENYKKMLKKKLDEARFKAASGDKKSSFSMCGNAGAADGPKRSSRAEETMKQMAEAQAAKEAKKAKKAVVVEAKSFGNGKIDAKGKIYDMAGNQVAQVNLKNGSITTVHGQFVGSYKAKSYMTKMAIQEVINKNSPYLIHQRKLAEQQRQESIPQIGGGFAGGVYGADNQTDAFGNSNATSWGNNNTDIWGNSVGGSGGWMGFFSGFFK